MSPLKILHIENSSIVRAGIAQILQRNFAQKVLVDGRSLNPEVDDLPEIATYDLIVLGLYASKSPKLVETIKKINSKKRVLIFARSIPYTDAMNCLLAGADGILTHKADSQEISESIKTVLAGRRYLCIDLLEKMAQEALVENLKRKQIDGVHSKMRVINPVNKLSKRQIQTAKHLIEGQSMKIIADTLGISTSTLATHKSILFQKLGIKTVVQLMDWYKVNSPI